MKHIRLINDLLTLSRIATGCLIATLIVNIGGCTQSDSDHKTASTKTPAESVVQTDTESKSDEVDAVASEHTDLARSTSAFDIKLDEPTNVKPFSVAAAILPQPAAAGETITLEVRAKTAPGWHFYAVDKPTGVAVATELKLTLPQGVTVSGPWSYPQPDLQVTGGSPTYVYHGEVSFRRELEVADDMAAAEHDVACEVVYQVCTAVSCLAPDTIQLTVPLKIVHDE